MMTKSFQEFMYLRKPLAYFTDKMQMLTSASKWFIYFL